MSSPKNRIVREISPGSLFPDASKYVTSTTDWNQGDLLMFDTATQLVKKLVAEADAATFLGIAISTVVDGKPASPYTTDVDASQATAGIPGPRHGVIAKMIAKTGDAFDRGDLVYADPATDANVVSSAGTKAIGVYVGNTVAAAAAGQEIECSLGHRYPGDVLVVG
jgi:hypothetical protein